MNARGVTWKNGVAQQYQTPKCELCNRIFEENVDNHRLECYQSNVDGVCIDCAFYTMPYNEFQQIFLSADWNNVHQRKGQLAFNLLSTYRPWLAEKIRGSYNLDPFHKDELLLTFWQFVEKNW